MTLDEAHDLYIAETSKPHGAAFADAVGRFQEGFLSDGVTADLDEAFRRAVDTAQRLVPAIGARHEAR